MALILVADDHPLNRHFLATLLSYHGYGINEASDGIDALRSAREERPDLIIADVAMPRMDGFAFVTALRADADLAHIPVIFYTATYRDVESRAIARAAGVQHLITKPSDPEVIVETVQKALGLSSPPPRHPLSTEQLRQYTDRLQRTNIRMSALIELSFELDAERDPDRLVRTACIAVRKIFDCDHAAIVLVGNEERVPTPYVDGDVDQTALMRAGLFFGPFMRNFGDASNPVVQQMSTSMRGLRSTLLVPMTSGRDLYGTIVLGKTIERGFTSDDERLGLAAAGQIRAAHESLMLYQAQRRQAAILARAHEDLESKIDERTRELRLANEALRRQMTERERIEEELRASREHLAALFDASPISIVSFDANRLTRTWNAAAERTFGWRADEVIGRPNPAVPPELQQEYDALIDRCLSGVTLTDIETQRAKKDGTRIDASISLAPLYGPHGTARGYVGILSDITGRKRTEEELRSSQERLRALSARVILIQEEERTRIARELHDDLGQLLTAIKIDAARIVQSLANGIQPPERVTAGILPLIDSTLDTVGRLVCELRPSRIGEIGLVAAIEKKLADFQLRTEIECELSIRPEQLAVRGDIGVAIFRILEEALTNVVRHSEATRAEVRLRVEADELLLEIRDNGRGIRDAERLSHESYGLIGMKERAYLLGGSFSITGVEGRGSIVVVRMPLGGRPT